MTGNETEQMEGSCGVTLQLDLLTATRWIICKKVPRPRSMICRFIIWQWWVAEVDSSAIHQHTERPI